MRALPLWLGLIGCVPAVHAQQASVWVDAGAAHSRLPAAAAGDATSQGLVGLRVRALGRGAGVELGSTAGRGTGKTGGAWVIVRGSAHASRVSGALDFGIRADAGGMDYLTPVQVTDGTEWGQRLFTAGVSPWAGVSLGRVRLGAEANWTGGRWQAEQRAMAAGAGPPLPPIGGVGTGRRTQRESGAVRLLGGTLSLLANAGRASLEVRATHYDARNAAAPGTYRSIEATGALSLGAVSLSVGARRCDSPVASSAIGGHVGAAIELGSAAVLQAIAGRTTADPIHATPGGFAFSAGLALRVGSRRLGPPLPTRVGSPSGTGHQVTFTLRRPDARTVAVAGDFSGWEPRPLKRGANGLWTLDTVIPPGLYHYSFIIDGGTWFVPSSATGIVDDGFGQKNAMLIVEDVNGREGR